VLTLHGRLDIPDVHPVYRAFPNVAYCSISDAQRDPLPDLPWAATVHHGLPPDLYRFDPTGGSYLLFVGRVSPEKQPDAAIRIARAAGVRLVMAAKVDPADRRYWEDTIQPMLGPGVDFIGEVDDRGKEELLRGASALLFPVDWPEPFGLVLIEALACGTPVVARRRGSVPEIIDDGETGFVCETEAELIAAVRRVGTIDRHACRRAFDTRFAVDRMVEAYVAVYEEVGGAERACA
jgi:glycosyltransferase involved in cell wall biosynthesis